MSADVIIFKLSLTIILYCPENNYYLLVPQIKSYLSEVADYIDSLLLDVDAQIKWNNDEGSFSVCVWILKRREHVCILQHKQERLNYEKIILEADSLKKIKDFRKAWIKDRNLEDTWILELESRSPSFPLS